MEYENNQGSSLYIIVLLESLMRPRCQNWLPQTRNVAKKRMFTTKNLYLPFQQTIKKKTRQQIPPKSEKNPKNNKDHYALVKVVQCFLVVANLHTMIQGLRHPVNT